jgi:ribulose-bisphosphate carboxylase large chain
MRSRIERLRARVLSREGNKVEVAYPLDLFEEGNIPQLLSGVAGNIFGMRSIHQLRLLDLHFPLSYVETFPGPRWGIEGVRTLMGTAESERPHMGTIVKPKVGLTPKETAQVAYDAFMGGCDLVKDDENLTNQRFCPFEERVIAVLDATDNARSDGKRMYAPNVTGPDMIKRAEFVEAHGGQCVMIDFLTAGFSALQLLRSRSKLVIHGHRAMHAAMSRNPFHGISMVVLAKLARLGGVDQLHVGTGVGKMASEDVLAVRDAASRPWGPKPVFPVCSGGMHPGIVGALIKQMGKNIVIQAGGGIHGHPDGTRAGARAMRQAIDAALAGIPADRYAHTHPELEKALALWGYTV